MKTRCLICGADASDVDHEYHPPCAKKLFGRAEAPKFAYTTEDLNAMAEHIIRNRMSVPGVQAKLSVHLERKGPGTPDRLTLVGLEGNYILKLPSERFPELPESEHACMSFARAVGITTADFGLVRLQSGALAYLSRRMDRPDSGVLHMEDFCQLTDRITAEKYRASMESVGKALRAYSSAPGLDAIRLYELVLFCFLTGNSDMHLKNFSLLRAQDGAWNLSPAYDLVPVNLHMPGDKEELALSLDGKKSNFTRLQFERFAAHLGLTTQQRERTERRLLRAAHENLDAVLACSFLSADFQDRLRTLVAQRLERLGESIALIGV